MNWRFWEPPHTVESVARRLVAGLRDGSVVLDEPQEEGPFDSDLNDDGIVVQIDVPEGASDAAILDYVKRCAITADEENRSHGGAGLRVGTILIQSPRVKVAFRPRNAAEPTNGM